MGLQAQLPLRVVAQQNRRGRTRKRVRRRMSVLRGDDITAHRLTDQSFLAPAQRPRSYSRGSQYDLVERSAIKQKVAELRPIFSASTIRPEQGQRGDIALSIEEIKKAVPSKQIRGDQEESRTKSSRARCAFEHLQT